MTFGDALRLGRVSNLPTVWTNVLAGVALGGAVPSLRTFGPVFAFSLFYVGGMYLNDAFDQRVDARERPERPIPSGRVSLGTVFTSGFAMLVAGVGALGWLGGVKAAAAGLGLGAAIVYYDAHHKGNALGPLLMGLCRALIYPCAALTVTDALDQQVWIAAGALWLYVAALTYIAKQPGVSGNVVVRLIAAISIVDTAILLALGQPGFAALAMVTVALTRTLQRFVPAN